MIIYFATSNQHKFNEAFDIASAYFRESKLVQLKRYPTKGAEIRSDSVEEIALESARNIYKKLKKPVFVEDTGLFIKSLNGFPGTYSGWVHNKIGTRGILSLLSGVSDRSAVFRTAIAFVSSQEASTFLGECPGTISFEERGDSGFAYDKIFIPSGFKHTFAQRIELKTKLSHRYKALMKFFGFLRSKLDSK